MWKPCPVEEWLKDFLLERYRESAYANYLQMDIRQIDAGETTVAMAVRPELTNLAGLLHGGALGSLLDMAMNLACFSLGRQVLILGFNTNFLRGARADRTVTALATVLHNGSRTMVVEGRILDEGGKLLAKGRGSFLAGGRFSRDETEAGRSSFDLPEEPRGEEQPLLRPKSHELTGWLRKRLLQVHLRNCFAGYLGMEITWLGRGECIVSLPVTPRHINIRGVVHGGALVSLADMSMMLACATLSKQTVTLDLNISFIRRVREGEVIRSYPRVIHPGETVMVAGSSILDEAGRLLAEARGSFFATGDYLQQIDGEGPVSK